MKSNSTRIVVVRFALGLALFNIAYRLNESGTVDWSTVFIGLVGVILVVNAIIDFFNQKK